MINCPFCSMIGCLNLHGFLYGYDDKQRGHRIFCSNRNRRKGCGRTFSILLAWFLKHFRLTACELWTFISGIIDGLAKLKAWSRTEHDTSQSFLYNISRRLKTNEPYIKTKLVSITTSFLQETFVLLKKCSTNVNPIQWFQEYFQDDFLKHKPTPLTI
jgi:hypothetical protein